MKIEGVVTAMISEYPFKRYTLSLSSRQSVHNVKLYAIFSRQHFWQFIYQDGTYDFWQGPVNLKEYYEIVNGTPPSIKILPYMQIVLQKCIYAQETKQSSKFQSDPSSNCFTIHFLIVICISFYPSSAVFWVDMGYFGNRFVIAVIFIEDNILFKCEDEEINHIKFL